MLKLAGIAAVALSFQVSVASAKPTVLDWSYSGPGINSGSGVMDANFDASIGGYDITSITGNANGYTILGPSPYDGADNHIFPPTPGVDSYGFSFSISATESFNIYNGGAIPAGQDYYCGGKTYCLLGPGNTSTGGLGDPLVGLNSFTVTVASVPEVSSWAMMLLGFAGLGWAGYSRGSRRRRRSAAPVE